MPASAASIIASAAMGGGTNRSEASAPVASTASRMVSNWGRFSTLVPPFPGVTPATTFVPASIISCVWNWPMRPVMPCTTTRVSSVIRMAMGLLLPYSAATGCGRAATAASAASASVPAVMIGTSA